PGAACAAGTRASAAASERARAKVRDRMEPPEKIERPGRAQFALVAVTTETELGVATPAMAWGGGGAGGFPLPEGPGADEVPPPPQAAGRDKRAATKAARHNPRCDVCKLDTPGSCDRGEHRR